MSAAQKLEDSLKKNLTKRIEGSATVVEGVSGSFVILILPLLVELLNGLMEGCNATPQRAAKRLKKLGPFQRNNIHRAVGRQEAIVSRGVQPECCESVYDTIREASEEDLIEMLEEQDEENIDWSPFGHKPPADDFIEVTSEEQLLEDVGLDEDEEDDA